MLLTATVVIVHAINTYKSIDVYYNNMIYYTNTKSRPQSLQLAHTTRTDTVR